MALVLLTAGCTLTLSPLAKHTSEFAGATTKVVDNSETAYLAANTLHRDEQTAAAIDDYGKPGWSPYTALKPLLTPEQLAARTKVLDGLKAYAQALDQLVETKKRNAKLDSAATSAGAGLQSLTKAGSADLPGLFPGMKGLSSTETNGVSTAIDGLGRLLLNSRAKQGLAKATTDMNPFVAALCNLIDNDVAILRRQADVDYQGPITNEDSFIQNTKMDPALKRTEIGKLLTLAAQQQANDALLAKLQEAVRSLAKTHQALMDAAQGKDPETIKQQLAELITFGDELGTYYNSLSSGSTK